MDPHPRTRTRSHFRLPPGTHQACRCVPDPEVDPVTGRANMTLLILCRNSDIMGTIVFILSVERGLNRNHAYQWTFPNEASDHAVPCSCSQVINGHALRYRSQTSSRR